jgi:nitrogen fixation protein NifZ
MSAFQLGDMVYAAVDLLNDVVEDTGAGGLPGLDPDSLLAAAGSRGVIVNVGHAEAQPEVDIYLVRFETGPDGVLGEPIGCLAEELGYTRAGA